MNIPPVRKVYDSETWTTLGPFNDLDTVYQAVPVGGPRYLRFVIETREPKPPPTWWDEHGEAVLFTGEAAFLMLAAWVLGMWLARLWRDNPRRWMDA